MSKSRNTAWAWREIPPVAPPSSNAAAATTVTRRRLAQIAVMLIAGAGLFFGLQHRLAGSLVWMLAGLMLAGILGCPKILAGFDRAGAWLGRTAGTATTWLLLAPIFYTVFGLGRLGLRLRGRDPLRRRWDPRAGTYWDDRAPITDPEHWSRQY